MVIKMKTALEYTQMEMRKEFKIFSTKIGLNTKEDSSARKGQKKLSDIWKTNHKMMEVCPPYQ